MLKHLPILEQLAEFTNDPLGFVIFSFPWGEPSTELANTRGPEPWQEAILLDLGKGIITAAEAIRLATTSGHGIGKALDNETILDTPQGRRRWGDLKVGDYVFGKDGKPTRIMAVHPQGKKPLFRVKFDDGTLSLACEDHVWTVKGRQQRRHNNDYVNLTTKELIKLGVKCKNGSAFARQWEIPRIEAPVWPDAGLPIEPYTLGIWLGDGCRGRITSADTEVHTMLADVESITVNNYGESRADTLSVAGLQTKLRTINLLQEKANTKYVPKQYKYTTPFNRAELLRGLLDIDGECNQAGSVIFNSVSRLLIDDVMWLARSLGGKAQMQPTVKQPVYSVREDLRRGQDCYRCTIQMPHGFQCFYVERKQERVKNVEERYLTRWIDSIEPAGERDCMCITVEAKDGLFLANDFICTHNSALVAWIILWAISTYENTVGVVTANTETQLKTKTWAQLAKWYRLFIGRDYFKMTATSIFSVDPLHEKTWRVDMVPWSERNTEAFAGLHNLGKRVLLIFDEASSIPDVIWETSEGALTDRNTQIIWAVFGNPTRNKGRFRECFKGGKFAHRWNSREIDSRVVSFTDKAQIEQWEKDYGEDSDFFRVRVKGVFPRIDAESFIPLEICRVAVARTPITFTGEPVVIGADIGRFGDDPSVIYPRKGKDATTLSVEVIYGIRGSVDTMTVAGRIAAMYLRHSASICFVDEGGVGGGVVDRLRQLQIPVIGVDFGSGADYADVNDGTKYANKRAEIIGRVRNALYDGLCIPERIPGLEISVIDEFTAPTYGMNNREEIQLESKKDMRRRGVKSTNVLDALACTYAQPVYIPRREDMELQNQEAKPPPDYNPFDEKHMYRALQ